MRNSILYMLCIAMTLLMGSCSDGEDGNRGEMGPVGEQGPDGDPGDAGEPGADGTNGQNGFGYNGLAQYGYITMVLEGTRADNVAFRDSTSFRFTPVEATDLELFNDLTISEVDDTMIYDLGFQRFFSNPDDELQDSYVRFDLRIEDLGEESEEVLENFTFFTIENYAVIGEDNKYFTMSGGFAPLDNTVSDFSFTDVTFDSETNRLTFSYSLTVAEDSFGNPTGNSLNISGIANVIVLETLKVP
ncbi:collagen-like triple helix repeat-containing protein [Flagellimonas sp. S174]|uniref:collagen-like triple helix repeat-containing protein n=1 Tax=Flagellimonas sp. S174 TaxID=3410790 RepID=UPI003BF573B3